MTQIDPAQGISQPVAAQWPRIVGLDGLRGVAALYVMLHHCWLLSFPGFPVINGPIRWAWLAFGHFAVSVFIVLSGFSLAIGPARDGWRLDEARRFFRRRAWRILPPYWAALALSLTIAWTIVPQAGSGPPTAKSVVVYGLLLQDAIGSPSPNGALWSIAVEAQLYLIFPLLIGLRRRHGALFPVVMVGIPVLVIGLLAATVPPFDKLLRFSPQMAVLFTLGMVTVGAVLYPRADRSRKSRVPLLCVAALFLAAGVNLMFGGQWTGQGYLWADLTVAPVVTLLVFGVASGRLAVLVRLLDSRPLRWLGRSSYSLYLIHAPIVVALHHLLVAPRMATGEPMLLVTLGIAVPVCLVTAACFAAVFELPFQRYRSREALTAALRARGSRVRARRSGTTR